jgi:hypothetical protein
MRDGLALLWRWQDGACAPSQRAHLRPDVVPAKTGCAAPPLRGDAGGMLHAVFHSGRVGNYDLWYTTSDDQGTTLSAPVPSRPMAAQIVSCISVGSDEAVGIWYRIGRNERNTTSVYDQLTGGSAWSSPRK